MVTQVSAGGWHNLALGEGGDVYSWGWNESGQLGLETDVQVNKQINNVSSILSKANRINQNISILKIFP